MSLLDHSTIDAALPNLGWERQGDEIVRTFDCGTFPKALEFVTALGERAEAANHHPDIDIRWKNVTLRLSTHDAGGLTQKDLDLAQAINPLAP
ncbi:MAG TPA: 4a-hydroxytetrahydrobiopterin dehydratase [Acidimicrobiales bacterium]|nr:4a-hydroxytetrahydrobiopterin dehydratase [Acidimicrobiales bacterium]